MLIGYMEHIQQVLKRILDLAGLTEPTVDVDAESRRLLIFINEGEWIGEWVPRLVADLGHIARTVGRKAGIDGMVYVDVNNYRKKRELIIVALAKAAARKVLITKGDVHLPPMNAYERRLVHTELATRPDVKTESAGEQKERYVVVKPLL